MLTLQERLARRLYIARCDVKQPDQHAPVYEELVEGHQNFYNRLATAALAVMADEHPQTIADAAVAAELALLAARYDAIRRIG